MMSSLYLHRDGCATNKHSESIANFKRNASLYGAQFDSVSIKRANFTKQIAKLLLILIDLDMRYHHHPIVVISITRIGESLLTMKVKAP